MDDPRLTADIAAALKPSGLVARGWLTPEPGDAPMLAGGKPAAAICLVGHGGGLFWPIFEAWWRMHPDASEPLDDWSKSVIAPVAVSLGGEAAFPSDRPWQPFQQWAMAAEGLRPSPLGLLIHPEFGLWHGYRGALLFDEDALGGPAATQKPVDAPDGSANHPCDSCAGQPCLSACPVGAFSPRGFDVSSCRAYLATDAGAQGCMRTGCLARDACPVGLRHRYGAAQIRFHMAAFQ